MRAREILFESPKKYLPMFDAVIGAVKKLADYDLKPEVTRTVREIEEDLGREDRIVWYLRWYRLKLVMRYVGTTSADQPEHAVFQQLWQRYSHEIGNVDESVFSREVLHLSLETMKHYATFPAQQMQAVVWLKQLPTELVHQLGQIEQKWAESRKQVIKHDAYKHGDGPELMIDFHNGWAWYDLEKASCDLESGAMGHCGNSAGGYDETVLSLRRDMGNGEFRPSLTFILDSDGEIGEMKGRANEKPAERYHDMIIALLLDDRVTGIKGGGYMPENNFSIKDLPKDVQEKLIEEKPALQEIDDLWWRIRDIQRVQKKECDPELLNTFVVKLDKELGDKLWRPAEIDMERERIIIRRWSSRREYIADFNSFAKTLTIVLEDDLPRMIAQHAPGISINTARSMCDAIRDDRFNHLFDTILPYDVEFVVNGVYATWKNGLHRLRTQVIWFARSFVDTKTSRVVRIATITISAR